MKRQNVRTLSLIVVTFTYLLLGAAIFDAFESEFEGKEETRLREHAEFLRTKYNITVDDFERITQLGIQMKPYKAGTQWKFAGAFYFATTVITTIGYGHSTPKTTGGKIFCMCYAVPGIPLCLVMFQSIGERMNTIITYLLRKTNQLLKLRNSVSQTKLMVVSSTIGSIVLTIGAAMFSRYEDWSYLDSFYYCFITLTTIGFGDFVALQRNDSLVRRPDYVAFSLIFILFGLTVVSSVMNLLVLRFLTMNTEDERRDQIEAAVYAHELQRLRGDVIWSSAEKLLPGKKFSTSNPDLILSGHRNAVGSRHSNSVSLGPPTCSVGCCSLCVKQLLWSSPPETTTSEVGNLASNQELRKTSSSVSSDGQTGHKRSSTTCSNNINHSVVVECDEQMARPSMYSHCHTMMNSTTPRTEILKLPIQSNPLGCGDTNLDDQINTCQGPIEEQDEDEEEERVGCSCVNLLMTRPELSATHSVSVEPNGQLDGCSGTEDPTLAQIHLIGDGTVSFMSQQHDQQQQFQNYKYSYPRHLELPDVGLAPIRQMVVEDQDSVFESVPMHYVHHRYHHHHHHHHPSLPHQYHLCSFNPRCSNYGCQIGNPERHLDPIPSSHLLAHHCWANRDMNCELEHSNPYWDFPNSNLILNPHSEMTKIPIGENSLIHAHNCIYPDSVIRPPDSSIENRRRASL